MLLLHIFNWLILLARCNYAAMITSDHMDGTLTGWTTDGNSNIPITSNNCPSASKCSVISGNIGSGNGYVEKTFSTQGCNNVQIKFSMKATGYDAQSGDKIVVKTYEDGAKHPIDTDLSFGSFTSPTTISMTPPPLAYWNDQTLLKIRFEWFGTGSPTMSSIYLNNLELIGSCTSPTTTTTLNPSSNPTKYPTKYPSKYPTNTPTSRQTSAPTKYPTLYPSTSPSRDPTTYPTVSPSNNPSSIPSRNPTKFPTVVPSNTPSSSPTKNPSLSPITLTPTNNPSFQPSTQPLIRPPTIRILPTAKPLNDGER
eukprot:552242_1